MNKVDKVLLKQIADLHSVPQGSYNIRKNGESVARVCLQGIDIESKADNSGIDVYIADGIKNQSLHIPVIVSVSGLQDTTYNNFYVGKNCDIVIVAGCGIHNTGNKKSGHNGIHSFNVGENSRVRYVEKHLGLGKGADKILNPTTNIVLQPNSVLEMETTQLGGVSYSNR